MRQRIDVAKSFERVDDPPVGKPPDYTDFPSGDVKVGVATRVTGIISQEGLHKRLADAKVITSEKSVIVPPVSIKPTVRIDIAKSFERVDDPPVRKPPDYTDYSSGDVKTRAMARVKGLISQEGLMKRNADIKFAAYDMKNERWLGGLVEKGFKEKSNEIKPVKVQPGIYVKPVKNFGILSAVDKFFDWLNKMLGA